MQVRVLLDIKASAITSEQANHGETNGKIMQNLLKHHQPNQGGNCSKKQKCQCPMVWAPSSRKPMWDKWMHFKAVLSFKASAIAWLKWLHRVVFAGKEVAMLKAASRTTPIPSAHTGNRQIKSHGPNLTTQAISQNIAAQTPQRKYSFWSMEPPYPYTRRACSGPSPSTTPKLLSDRLICVTVLFSFKASAIAWCKQGNFTAVGVFCQNSKVQQINKMETANPNVHTFYWDRPVIIR